MRVSLDFMGLLGVKGKDAVDFLQGQFTCDVKTVSPSISVFGAHANPQGRLFSVFKLFLKDDTYLMQLPLQSVESAKAALAKYKVFYKSSLEDKSAIYKRIGYIDESPTCVSTLPDATHNCVTEGDFTVLYWEGKTPRYEVIAPAPSAASITTPDSEQAWYLQDIQMGYPQIYPDTLETFLPHFLNLKELGALNFKKGCYTGQEIIARMEYLGKLKQKMYYAQVHTSQLPLPGDTLFTDEKTIGTVVDAVQEKNIVHMLVVLPIELPVTLIFLDELYTIPVRIST